MKKDLDRFNLEGREKSRLHRKGAQPVVTVIQTENLSTIDAKILAALQSKKDKK